jgi:hypothetical protein
MRERERSAFVRVVEPNTVRSYVIEVNPRVWPNHSRRRLGRPGFKAPDGRKSFLFAHGIESIRSIHCQTLNETLAGVMTGSDEGGRGISNQPVPDIFDVIGYDLKVVRPRLNCVPVIVFAVPGSRNRAGRGWMLSPNGSDQLIVRSVDAGA